MTKEKIDIHRAFGSFFIEIYYAHFYEKYPQKGGSP
jgi:hypothetical protein